MKNLPYNIKKAREDMGLSQDEFSELCGLSRSSIARYELGRSVPNRVALTKLAAVLNTTVSVLLGEDSEDEPIKKEPAVDLSGFDPDLVEAMRGITAEEKPAVLAFLDVLKSAQKK